MVVKISFIVFSSFADDKLFRWRTSDQNYSWIKFLLCQFRQTVVEKDMIT